MSMHGFIFFRCKKYCIAVNMLTMVRGIVFCARQRIFSRIQVQFDSLLSYHRNEFLIY